ncbi:MAG: helix-turn-helix transcriptional regulator [Lachnospiraceae bacterium]|nr:helix-turn-helix transcriptional regulator [Lachnospiraceae bacterium]MBQ9341384.1 helix-turn-helix transcriptional regulator [Lachnospiraceae bacterium]
MFEKRDAEKEEKMIQEIIAGDEELKREHALFEAQMYFKQELIKARKARKYTQNDVSRMSGLSQQAVSRLERGKGGTVETIFRYLNSIGYVLDIKEGK